MNYEEFSDLSVDKKLSYLFKQIEGLKIDKSKLTSKVSNLYEEVELLKKELR